MLAKDFLLEIGCEELPPARLQKLSRTLAENIKTQLDEAELSYKNVQAFATPRRLAVQVSDLIESQPPREIERQGPSLKAAYDKNGTPTLACLGFARSCGISTDQLKIKETKKGKWVYCRLEQPGKPTVELLPEVVNAAIKKLPIRKPMRWGNHDTLFVRPVHWVVMLYGKELIEASILGQSTSRETRGHRFHHTKPISITQAKDYQQLLHTHGMVMVDYEKRREQIRKLIDKAAAKVGSAIIEEDLLDEVTSMVEWPTALLGQFKSEFLELPPEVLITSMKVHQRCFPVVNNKNELQSCFVLISNIDSKNPKAVIQGNERVINARLADASFFYDNDLRQTLESRLEKLEGVVFQRQLGSVGDKAKRISALSGFIAKQLDEDTILAKRSGLLAKCDLVSEMVYEFPSVQGTMGYYYALHDNEPKEVALAIKEQYQPRFSGDELPATAIGCCVALADRLDTLIGILGINKSPTGDKDPFALRRAALGILRIIIEKELPLDLLQLLKHAHKNYEADLPNQDVDQQAFEFIMDRLRAWYLDKSISPDVFAAVSACKPTAPLDFHQRIQAVQQFQTLPEAGALAAANKRVSNILRKQAQGVHLEEVDDSLFESDAERNLANLLKSETKTVEDLYKKADYQKALSELSTLKEPVDTFFDEVMVMVDDQKTRNNRLALLESLRALFSRVADISLLS